MCATSSRFVLNSEDLRSTTSPMSDASRVDELSCYIFDVAPKPSRRSSGIFKAACGWTTTTCRS